MCKHVAAVLYGIGARLDERPDLLFLLRNVDHRGRPAGDRQAARTEEPGHDKPTGGYADGIRSGDAPRDASASAATSTIFALKF
jgi:uncharacterized Zn finger protein